MSDKFPQFHQFPSQNDAMQSAREDDPDWIDGFAKILLGVALIGAIMAQMLDVVMA